MKTWRVWARIEVGHCFRVRAETARDAITAVCMGEGELLPDGGHPAAGRYDPSKMFAEPETVGGLGDAD